MARLCALLLVFCCASAIAGEPDAWRQKVSTPHWQWTSQESSKKAKALFLVDYLAGREPDELAQRFQLDAVAIPTTGDAYLNRFDEKALLDGLKGKPDVLVLAAFGFLRDLSGNARQAIRDAVHAGLPVAVFARQGDVSGIGEWLGAEEPSQVEIAPSLKGFIEKHKLPATFMCAKAGQGSVVFYSGFNAHFTNFCAFSRSDWDDSAIDRFEAGYAVSALAINLAIHGAGALPSCTITADSSKAGEIAAACSISGDAEGKLSWWLHLAGDGRELQQGELALSPATAKKLAIKSLRSGAMVLRWRLHVDGKPESFGALPLNLAGQARLARVALGGAESAKAGGQAFDSGFSVNWKAEGAAAGDLVQVQVCDPDRNIVAMAQATAESGNAKVPGWEARFIAHKVRLLLVRAGEALDEQALDYCAPWDRLRDGEDFSLVLWATEQGAGVERWRYPVLRELGITAMATPGLNQSAAKAAAEAGLRLVPTNVYVTPKSKKLIEKYSTKGDEARRELGDFAASMRPYSPLGYSLCDEPSGADPVEWRKVGQKVIQGGDPGARVGYCGFWCGGEMADFLAGMDYATGYSPGHLYTPNLWLGVERDIYRSFRQPGGVFSCWTHYAPWLDHEPYSRTAPWLWLFDEMNSIAYFDSAGEFAVLPASLSATHETRWWSEEAKAIKDGIGAQIIRSKRELGFVQLVYSPGAFGFDAWVRALNRLGVPYGIIDRTSLSPEKIDARVKLIICPDAKSLPDPALAAFQKALAGKCSVIATACTAAFGQAAKASMDEAQGKDEGAEGEKAVPAQSVEKELGEAAGADEELAPAEAKKTKKATQAKPALAAADRLRELFGVVRAEAKAEGWQAAREQAQSLPLEAKLLDGSLTLSGSSCGETGIAAQGAEVIATYSRIGETEAAQAEQAPGYVQKVFATPAAVRKQHDGVAAWYFTFQPNAETLEKWLPSLLKDAGVPAPECAIETGAANAGTAYLFPFRDGEKRFVGLVQDYWRIKAAGKLSGEGSKDTASYFQHGPQRWDDIDATFRCPAGLQVYNVRTGQHLGQGPEVKLKSSPAKPELLALLPYEAKALALELPRQAQAGGKLPVAVKVESSPAGKADGHVIHLRLTSGGEGGRVLDERNAVAANGMAKAEMPIPFNVDGAKLRLFAKDGASGLNAMAEIETLAPQQRIVDPLPAGQVKISREPLDCQPGKYGPAEEKIEDVKAGLDPLNRAPGMDFNQNYGMMMLTSAFSLANAEASYRWQYKVANNWEGTNRDRRLIDAPSPPGLSFTAPAAYSGYFGLKLNSFSVSRYAISRIEARGEDKAQRIVVEWDTPEAMIELSFAMLPGHTGVFQELLVKPVKPLRDVELALSPLPGGRSIKRSQDGKSWMLAEHETQDQAYGKGPGTSALLVLPEEWDKVNLVGTPSFYKLVDASITKESDKVGDSKELGKGEAGGEEQLEDAPPANEAAKTAGKEMRFHWVIWLMPRLSNAKAEAYMAANAESARQSLRNLYGLEKKP